MVEEVLGKTVNTANCIKSVHMLHIWQNKVHFMGLDVYKMSLNPVLIFTEPLFMRFGQCEHLVSFHL